MDSKSRIVEKIVPFLPLFNEEFLVSISNKGVYKRSLKDFEKMEKEKADISLDENGNLKVKLDEIETVLTGNIQDSLCSCPASGICKHILISLLFLKEFYENNSEDTEAVKISGKSEELKKECPENSEGMENAAEYTEAGNRNQKTEEIENASENTSFQELKSMTGETFLEMIGKKTFNSLINSLLIRDDCQFREERTLITAVIKTQNVRIYFPQEKTIRNSMCSCKGKGICSHKAYALASYLIRNGKIGEESLGENKIEIGEREQKFLEMIQNFVASVFYQGIGSLSEGEIEKAEKYYIQAYGLGFFSLAGELKDLSSELGFYFSKNIMFSNRRLVHILSIIFNRASSLKISKDPVKLGILAGKREEDRFNLNSVGLTGVGSSAAITRRSDLLITVYFYSRDLKKFLSMSTLRPFENQYQLKTLFNLGAVWSSELSFRTVSDSKIILKDARLTDEKVSMAKSSKAGITGNTEESDIEEIAEKDYSEILACLKKNRFRYFEQHSQKLNVFLVKVSRIENVRYDEIVQKLKFDCLDGKGNKIEFSISYSPVTSKLIEFFEKKDRIRLDYILGKLYEKNDAISGIFLDGVSNGKIQNLYFR